MSARKINPVQEAEIHANPFKALHKIRARMIQAAADPRRLAGFLLTPAELRVMGAWLESLHEHEKKSL